MNLRDILSTSPHYTGNEQGQQVRFQIVILGFKGLNNPVHLFWRLHCQASRHSKCRAPHMDHMHAAVHSSVTYGCQLVNMQKCIIY